MLPFDKQPWARSVATTVVLAASIGVAALALFLHSRNELHIPEVAIIILTLLLLLPPNIAIIRRTPTHPK